MDSQKVVELETLAKELGRLEDDAFRLDQGHISFLIARARSEVQTLLLQSRRYRMEMPVPG
jgi:hypothetical protein